MHFYKKIAANTFYQIIAQIISSGTSFVITIIIAKHFGILGYADYAKTTAFVSLFYFLADLGLNAIFLQQEDAHLRFRDIFYARAFLSIGLVLLVNGLELILPFDAVHNTGFSPMVRIYITIFSFTLITESILYSAAAVFQRKLVYKFMMIASLFGSVTSFAFVALFSLWGFPLKFILLAFAFGGIAESLSALFFTDEELFPLKIDFGFVKKIAKETLPITLMLFFNLIYFRIDMILLSVFRPGEDVAIYDLSYKVFDFLIALPLFLSNVLYPMFLEAEKNSRKVKPKLIVYTLVFIGLGILVALPVWFLSPLLSFIRIEFIKSVIPLHILLLSLPIFFATSILQWLLIAKKQQLFLMYIYLFATILNVILNVIFIPSYGYVASAIITGISELLVLLILFGKLFLKNEKNTN